MLTIRTPRLELVAATIEHILAELESADSLAALLSARVPPGWPPGEYDRDAMEFFRSKLEEEGESSAGWYGWYAIARDDSGGPGLLVAGAGYMGPPGQEGDVEIGYSVVPQERGKGYASEIVDALVQRAFRHEAVRYVVARTVAGNAASRIVLERNGFILAEEGPEPGNLTYERRRP